MTSVTTVVLLLALVFAQTTGCAGRPVRAAPFALKAVAGEVLGGDAVIDFSGMSGDTSGWRLRISIPGFTAADSAAVAARVGARYADLLDESAVGELYVEGKNWDIAGDTARVEAKFGARWPCGNRWSDSFAAYFYRFVLDRGTWRFLDRRSAGHSYVGPCPPTAPR